MQIKTILIAALAALTCCTAANAQRKKKVNKKAMKSEVPAPAVPASVDAETFSYALGIAQGQSLKQYLMQREGVDSTLIPEAMKGMQSGLSEQEAKKMQAFAAGLRIADMNRRTIPMINKQAVGREDSAYCSLKGFERGLLEAVSGAPALSPDSALKIVEQQFAHQKAAYAAANKMWLAANKERKGVKTLKSGLQYAVEKAGKGPVATDSTEVEVHYEGKLIDGTVFDSSYKRGKSATFRPDQVIKGWREALTMMPEGSTWLLYIPAELAYGERDQQNIPAGSTLIFKVENIKVKQPAK